MNDLRFAVRMLAKSPSFTLGVLGLLGVGICATTVIFSLVNAVLLRPLPVKQPQKLIQVVQRSPELGMRTGFPYALYEALLNRATTLAAVFGEVDLQVVMNEPAPAEQIHVHLSTPQFFATLGVPALFGRTLNADDATRIYGTPPAVISYRFWRRRFNADPHAIGRMVVLHGYSFVIVGIMPSQFNGISVDTSPDIRVSLSELPLLAQDPQQVSYPYLELAGRLKPGVTRAEAQAECLVIWRNTMEEYWKRLQRPTERITQDLAIGIELDPLERGISILRDRFSSTLLALTASVSLLQLMLCANLAGLMLARGFARRGELAVRLALGATRRKLVLQLFSESALLMVFGAASSVALAYSMMPFLLGVLPPLRDLNTSRLTLSLDVGPDWRVLLFSLVLSAVTVLFFGLAPAISSSHVSIDSVLRSTRSSRALRGRRGAMVVQVALCTFLLAGACLMVRTVEQLHKITPGFDQNHIVSFGVNATLSGYTATQANALRLALMVRVRGLPGVLSAATASIPIMRGSGVKLTVAPAGQRVVEEDLLNVSINNVSPGYFETMGIQTIAGNVFTDASSEGSKPAKVVVNETFVRHFFPSSNPIGRHFGVIEDKNAFEIIGVVGDAKYRSLREPVPPTFYGDDVGANFVLYVRTRTSPESVIQPVRSQLTALDPTLPFTEIHTLTEEVNASMASDRLSAALASIFGVLAALLTTLGIYGLFTFVVAQQQREIAIHMAVGATPIDIVKMIAFQALTIVFSGVIAGLAAALLFGPLIRSLLYGIGPNDPASLSGAAALVIVIAAIGVAIPTSHAANVEPAAILRRGE